MHQKKEYKKINFAFEHLPHYEIRGVFIFSYVPSFTQRRVREMPLQSMHTFTFMCSIGMLYMSQHLR